MKILFYVPYYPDKIRVRPYNLIKALSKQGHNLHVVTNCENNCKESFTDAIEISSRPISAMQQLINLGVGGMSLGPIQYHYSWNPDNYKNISVLLEQNSFDVVHIEHLRGAKVGINLKKSGIKQPIIWDSVDNISALFRQTFKHNTSLLRKMIARFELIRTPSYELLISKTLDQTAITSENDKQAFMNSGAAPDRLHVIPNGIDLEYFAPVEFEEMPNTIVITGKMSYHANNSMALNTINNIMPLVWGRRENAQLIIAGKDPSREILQFADHPNITVTGEVKDMAEMICSSAIAAAPLKYAVGIQNKILEAMACGKAVVTNSLGNSSIQARDGREILVADSNVEFADFIIQLLDSKNKRNEIGNNARVYVEKHFSWDKAARMFTEIYQKPFKMR